MKKSQLALAALAVSSIIILSFNSTPAKPFVSKTFSYIKGSPNQRIEPGYYNQKDARENSITDSMYTNTANWGEASNAATAYTISDASYISSVTIYNWEKSSNGNDEDGISLQEALDVIYKEYKNSGYPARLEIDLNGNGASAFVACDKSASPQ